MPDFLPHLAPLLLLLPAQTIPPNQPTHLIHVLITDTANAPLNGAHLVIHRDPSLPPSVPDRSLDVDASGKADLAFHAGIYDICAMSPAYTPICRKVTLQDRDLPLAIPLPTSSDIADPQPSPAR